MSGHFFEENLMSPNTDVSLSVGNTSYDKAISMVRDKVSQRYDSKQIQNAGPEVSKGVKEIATNVYYEWGTQASKNGLAGIPFSLEEFVAKAESDLFGMGELDPLLSDSSIEDIAINGPNEIFIFKNGKWERTLHTFPSSDRLQEILNRGISASGRTANNVNPIVDAILPAGERISVVTYPVVPNAWPVASIRSQRVSEITLTDLASANAGVHTLEQEALKEVADSPLPDYASVNGPGAMLSTAAASYLHAAVLAGLNIVVLGPTGVGKTTFLTALGRLLPKNSRILIIEDTPEIKIHPDSELPNNVIYLRTRPSNQENILPVTQEHLVRLALRQRPDALTLGEARGAEIYDLLNALYTGHKNGLTSLHAYSATEMFGRIRLMLATSESGREFDSNQAAELVSKTLNIVISLELNGSIRRISSIVELTGGITTLGGKSEPSQQVMFRNSGPGVALQGPENESAFSVKFKKMGIPDKYFRPE